MSTTDRREMTDDLGILLRAALPASQAGIWTALPAIISSFDADKGTCECLPTIQLQRNVSGIVTWINFPKLVDCPVIFPSGGGYTLTFPIKPDDEVLVIFASRCIDAWFASGKNGIQNELRMHDASDGFVICGPRSYPNRLAGVSTENVQLRSDDGTTYVEITPTGVSVQADLFDANAIGQATITAPIIVLNGNVEINGTLIVTELAMALDFKPTIGPGYLEHKHNIISGSNLGPPVPFP